jgi:hypothetical protein
MGIRFHCPNGHKLNVKADLAGRRAICPECGARLLVPVESAIMTGGSSSQSSTRPTPELSRIANRRFAPAAPAPKPEVVSPAAVWFLRPRSGGQYGPATEEVFRTWMAEGRVAADAHVWRDGWSDWKLVRDAVNELPASLDAIAPSSGSKGVWPVVDASVDRPAEPPRVASALETVQPAVNEKAIQPGSLYLAHRKRANKRQLTLALSMFAVVVILACVLVWVLIRDDSTAPSATQGRVAPLESQPITAYAARGIGPLPGESAGGIARPAKDEWLS